jgi:hypothetical protein
MRSVIDLLRQVRDWLDAVHLQWALREIHPTHRDVPRIVVRLRELEARRLA